MVHICSYKDGAHVIDPCIYYVPEFASWRRLSKVADKMLLFLAPTPSLIKKRCGSDLPVTAHSPSVRNSWRWWIFGAACLSLSAESFLDGIHPTKCNSSLLSSLAYCKIGSASIFSVDRCTFLYNLWHSCCIHCKFFWSVAVDNKVVHNTIVMKILNEVFKKNIIDTSYPAADCIHTLVK